MSMSGEPRKANLKLSVTVRDGKTMTQHRMGAEGTLSIRNESDEPLVITCVSGGEPFLEEGCSGPAAQFTVPGGGTKVVRIARGFDDEAFAYSAQVGDSEPEDPIVILDRR